MPLPRDATLRAAPAQDPSAPALAVADSSPLSLTPLALASTNTVTVLLAGAPLPSMDSVFALVSVSELLEPLSLPAWSVTAIGAWPIHTLMVRVVVLTPSLIWTVKLSVPL